MTCMLMCLVCCPVSGAAPSRPVIYDDMQLRCCAAVIFIPATARAHTFTCDCWPDSERQLLHEWVSIYAEMHNRWMTASAAASCVTQVSAYTDSLMHAETEPCQTALKMYGSKCGRQVALLGCAVNAALV